VDSSPLTAAFIPASLVIIMFGMGLTLEAADFRRVFETKRATLIGVLAQVVFVPLIGLAVVTLFPLDPPLAAGVMIIAACPGGAVSNLISFLARADLALSITLTACSSLLAPFTVPLVINAALVHLMGRSAAVELPLLTTALKLFLLTVAPVVLAMEVRRRRRSLAERAARLVTPLSALFLAAVIVIAVSENIAELPRYLLLVGPAVLALNVAAMIAGWGAAAAARLEGRQQLTIAIETGIQNGALGIAIPATFIGNAEMAIPPAIYGVVMIGTATAVALWRRRGAVPNVEF
jgi:BASS family bile acid:Na+ symporter